MKDVVVECPAPQMMIGATVHAQLDALEVNDQGDRFLGYGEEHARSTGSSPTIRPRPDSTRF